MLEKGADEQGTKRWDCATRVSLVRPHPGVHGYNLPSAIPDPVNHPPLIEPRTTSLLIIAMLNRQDDFKTTDQQPNTMRVELCSDGTETTSHKRG